MFSIIQVQGEQQLLEHQKARQGQSKRPKALAGAEGPRRAEGPRSPGRKGPVALAGPKALAGSRALAVLVMSLNLYGKMLLWTSTNHNFFLECAFSGAFGGATLHMHRRP